MFRLGQIGCKVPGDHVEVAAAELAERERQEAVGLPAKVAGKGFAETANRITAGFRFLGIAHRGDERFEVEVLGLRADDCLVFRRNNADETGEQTFALGAEHGKEPGPPVFEEIGVEPVQRLR